MADGEPPSQLTVEGAGVALAVREWGAGPAMLLIHGMGDSAIGWRAHAERLAPHARVIAHDRRGYGDSGAPEPYERTTVQEQAEDAAAVIRALDAAPAVLVGPDIGGLIALDLAHRHAGLARGAVIVEPPLFSLTPAATEPLSAERLALEADLREGGPRLAMRRHLERGGLRTERGDRPREDAPAFFADYGAQSSWPVTRAELRSLTLPVVLMCRGSAPPHVHMVVDALAALLPDARVEEGDDPVPAARELLARPR